MNEYNVVLTIKSQAHYGEAQLAFFLQTSLTREHDAKLGKQECIVHSVEQVRDND